MIYKKWKNHKTNGYRNLAKQIRIETGWIFSDWLAHNVCKNLKIRCRSRKPKYVNPGMEHVDFPNIINGDWTVTRPFEKIVTDTTILKNRYKSMELTMYIDVYNNEVISKSVSENRHGHNIQGHMKALRLFLEEKTKRGYASVETILHSDQGIAYTSRAFSNAHKDYNIIRSMSRVGTPTDNPKIESLNGWFNNERLAYSLQYKTPNQVKLESGFN